MFMLMDVGMYRGKSMIYNLDLNERYYILNMNTMQYGLSSGKEIASNEDHVINVTRSRVTTGATYPFYEGDFTVEPDSGRDQATGKWVDACNFGRRCKVESCEGIIYLNDTEWARYRRDVRIAPRLLYMFKMGKYLVVRLATDVRYAGTLLLDTETGLLVEGLWTLDGMNVVFNGTATIAKVNLMSEV